MGLLLWWKSWGDFWVPHSSRNQDEELQKWEWTPYRSYQKQMCTHTFTWPVRWVHMRTVQYDGTVHTVWRQNLCHNHFFCPQTASQWHHLGIVIGILNYAWKYSGFVFKNLYVNLVYKLIELYTQNLKSFTEIKHWAINKPGLFWTTSWPVKMNQNNL